MTITMDAPNKRATLNFTEQEWLAVRYIQRIDGGAAFRTRLEDMLVQRLAQKRERRKEIETAALEQASPQTRQQVLALLGIDYGDE